MSIILGAPCVSVITIGQVRVTLHSSVSTVFTLWALESPIARNHIESLAGVIVHTYSPSAGKGETGISGAVCLPRLAYSVSSWPVREKEDD